MELGKVSTVISFNPLKKKFTLTNSSETKLEGFYYIVLTLSNKYSQSSRYGMTIHITCPDVEIESIQNYDYTKDEDFVLPYIYEIDEFGLVSVKFNAIMVPKAALNDSNIMPKTR